MKVGTIRKTRVCAMRYGGCLSPTRDPRERNFPTDHSHAARPGTPAQSEYQRDSSSKRTAFSITSSPAVRVNLNTAATPMGGRKERNGVLTNVAPYQRATTTRAAAERPLWTARSQ